MTRQLSPSLERLAAVNPVSVDDQLGSTPQAQATLQSIITTAPRAERRRRPRVGGLALAVIALLLASGGAFAATDPFGWWHSSNPQTALYRPEPALGVHVTDAGRCALPSNRGPCLSMCPASARAPVHAHRPH